MATFPEHFGVVRHCECDHASHSLIYEHKYVPKPVRSFNKDGHVDLQDLLRPSISDGKIDFLFCGSNNPVTADHARCWLGNALLQEVKNGRLGEVEYLAASHPPIPPGVWRWHVWPQAGQGSDRGQPVEVNMWVGTPQGIAISVHGLLQADQELVFRVLQQYCDCKDSWTPIPSPPHGAGLAKVHPTRAIPQELARPRLEGLPLPEAATSFLIRSLREIRCADDHVRRYLEGIDAAMSRGPSQSLAYLENVEDAFAKYVKNAAPRVKPEWQEKVSEAFDQLLPQLEGRAEMEKALELLAKFGDFGMQMPRFPRDPQAGGGVQ
mmetsp:Transcript_35829/g.66740  ORF Transcript_35829/g.66740 Transcript_35829/m.66740 type:complete len:322 (+) Transcript_35829:32-997(+)